MKATLELFEAVVQDRGFVRALGPSGRVYRFPRIEVELEGGVVWYRASVELRLDGRQRWTRCSGEGATTVRGAVSNLKKRLPSWVAVLAPKGRG